MEILTLDEVRARFGSGTVWREALMERLVAWIGAATSTGRRRRLWMFGSFVTDKPFPRDIDVLAMFDRTFDPTSMPGSVRHWYDHELCRELHSIDLFWFTDNTDQETATLLLTTFGCDRSGQAAIVEVAL